MTATQDSIREHPRVCPGKRDIPCKLHCRQVPISADLPAVTEAFSRRPHASVIGGNPAKANADGFTYWAAEPADIFEFESGQDDPFGKLQDALTRYRPANSTERTALPGPFRGGWIGYFSYELGRYIERLPQTTVDDLGMPLIRLCFYDRLIAYDHHKTTFWALALERPDDVETPAQKLASVETILAEAQDLIVPEPQPVDVENVDLSRAPSNIGRKDYLQAIGRAKRYIRDGEIYQVNLSQRFRCPFRGRPIDLFHWQNRYNPSPYAAYVDTGQAQIVSASPEMFITIEDGQIQTMPIKGTRPRLMAGDPSSQTENERNRAALLQSPKEQAELNMIVDLERNDLARICLPGTRHVIQPRTIEAYPTVFHAVATIGGQLGPDTGFCDILKAVFPGGSITGAPKIRAMEIIDELEPTTRGVYTGSIGFIGLDGTACLNIAIRTVMIAAGQAFVQSGGGIVADSVPQAEWEETITKARALLAGIAAVQKS